MEVCIEGHSNRARCEVSQAARNRIEICSIFDFRCAAHYMFKCSGAAYAARGVSATRGARCALSK